MDSSMNDDCLITDVTYKEKKLKQAELSLRSLSSIETQRKVYAKKRKLTSPVECRIPKVLKATAKENAVKNKVNNNINTKSTSMIDELNNIKGDTEWIEWSDINEANENKSSDLKSTKKHNDKFSKKGLSKFKKEENKNVTVSSTLTKFLRRMDKEAEKKETTSNNTKKIERTEWTVEDINNCFDKESKKSNKIKSCLVNDSSMAEDKVAFKNELDTIIISDPNVAIVSSETEDNKNKMKIDEEIMVVHEVKSPLTPTKTKNKLTLKQQEKKRESNKRQEERDKRKMERKKEREDQRKEKEEKRRAEKEQKRKEKELKEHKRQKEMEQKQKEKEAKEQERRRREEAKEEEKKKKKEEKLEAERKMQKTVSNFASFFVPKKHETKSVEEENNTNIRHFMPFEVKADMRIAPICRRSLNEHEKLMLDEMCNKNDVKKCDLYLSEMKINRSGIHKSGKTWPLEAKDDNVVMLDEEENGNVIQSSIAVDKNRPKLLQFYENRRPPYWGTWRKRSNTITPRRPFSKDLKSFDYEIDSDEEWEEEEPGESLHDSEDEKDEENADDNEYDVDNEFMVPHGYLSDEEAQADEEGSGNLTPETQKFKLKLLGEEFEAERKAKTLKLKPIVIDCIWLDIDDAFPENTASKVAEFLTSRHAWIARRPVILESVATNENAEPEGGQSGTRKSKVPEEALPDLIRLIHGNIYSRKFLAKEFVAFWKKKEQHANGDKRITKASIQEKIREIAEWIPCPENGEMHSKTCWYVSVDIRKKFLPENEDLPLPNHWKYNLTRKPIDEIRKGAVKIIENIEKDKKNVPLITQFTKKITQEEMKQQLVLKPPSQTSNSKADVQQKAPKRALLISLPRKEK